MKCLGARTVITKHLLKPITKSTWQHTPRLLPKGLERATSAVKDSKGCPDWERMNYEFTKTAKVYTKYVLMKNQYLPFHKILVLIRIFLYSVNIVTSALHKSQVSWNIWPLSTKRGPMEKNSKIILNVASALLPVWRKYWFQKNDGNLYNILNHFFRDHILKVHNLRKHTDISDMKYRCSICPYATIENAALKKHIRFKHTHDVRNPSFQIEIFLLEMCTCIV